MKKVSLMVFFLIFGSGVCQALENPDCLVYFPSIYCSKGEYCCMGDINNKYCCNLKNNEKCPNYAQLQKDSRCRRDENV